MKRYRQKLSYNKNRKEFSRNAKPHSRNLRMILSKVIRRGGTRL